MKQSVLSLIFVLKMTAFAIAEVDELKPTAFVVADTSNNDKYIKPFRDSSRQLWRINGRSYALMKWDDKTRSWNLTPVKAAARPDWDARPAPPWQHWAGPPVCFHGRDGAVLAVLFSDIYQSMPKEKFTGSFSQRLAEEPEEEYWPDAWLYREGKWSNRHRLVKLLTDEHAYLVKNFADSPTISPSFIDLQVCRDLIWITYDGDVSAFGNEGRIATWRRPNEWARGSETWTSNLVRLTDGTLWYAVGRRVVPLSLDGDRIVPAASIETPQYSSASLQNLRVSRSGDVWLEGLPYRSFLFRDGKWELVGGLGELTFEDANGGLWFLPGGGEGMNSEKGYTILQTGKRYRLQLPGNFRKCTVTAVDRDMLLASGGDRVIILERSTVEPGWAIRNVLAVKGVYVCAPVWIDNQRNLVSQGWSAELPPGFLP